jgi:predicted AAA+ superfamily ATPase
MQNFHGIADTTVRRYLDILSGTFMIRQLYPWIENIAKRQVKSPKIFFRDSGLLREKSFPISKNIKAIGLNQLIR